MNKIDIKSMLPSELEGHFNLIGEKGYRAKQVFKWLHDGAMSFDEMTNLPGSLRVELSEQFKISSSKVLEKQTSKVDGTVKFLRELDDGASIESVLMNYKRGSTVCISTQVGCRMGCLFCASGENGLVRNLSASEILDQVLFFMKGDTRKISNVVLMGIGEPLDNFDNVIRFVKLLIHPLGVNVGARHITVSTCGIIENIDKLADYGIQLTLAISLHAPDDLTRRQIMPIAHNYSVDDLFDAGSRYFKKTGRRVTYEYSLINDVNDSLHQARLLSQKLLSTGSHLNIIPFNNIRGHDFIPSDQKKSGLFLKHLEDNGVNYTVRRSLGSDIAAACGLLRQKKVIGDNDGALGNNRSRS